MPNIEEAQRCLVHGCPAKREPLGGCSGTQTITYRGNKGIELIHSWVGNAQAIDGNAIQSSVVKYHYAICIQGEPLERKQRIVRLHHHVALSLVPVRKHRVGLDQLFRKMIIQSLQQV